MALTIRLGISACLTGAMVRYNKGHKHSALCTEQLGRHFEWVPVCPEMAIGLGTPRQPIRLIGHADSPRAMGSIDSSLDVTDALKAYGEQIAATLTDISGYIFMQKSPSCGMERVKVYHPNSQSIIGTSAGLFAKALMQARPDLPTEEDGRLHDPVLRENFVTRVFAYAHWQQLLKEGLSRNALYGFHARYKYQLMANSRVHYQSLGKLLGQSAKEPLEPLAARYFSELMQALKIPATRGSHTNVLQHIAGYLKRGISTQDKQELHNTIIQYQQGIVPLVVPMALIKHHFGHHPDPYIAQQIYIQPHPEDLGLRNAL